MTGWHGYKQPYSNKPESLFIGMLGISMHLSHNPSYAVQHPGDPQVLANLAQAENQLLSTLGRFFALAENYPDLKANQTMMQFTEELTTTGNKVIFARQAFNDAVMDLNTAIQSFPAVLFAGNLCFTQADMLQPLERKRSGKRRW